MKVSRILIKDYEEAIKAKQAALDKAVEANTLSEEQIALEKAEIVKVREALQNERDAMESKQREVDSYKKVLAKEVKKKNFYKSLVKILGTTTAISAAVAAAVILQE